MTDPWSLLGGSQKDSRRGDKFQASRQHYQKKGGGQPTGKNRRLAYPLRRTSEGIGYGAKARFNRQQNQAIASETVEILETGSYTTVNDQTVDINNLLDPAIENTVTYTPEQLPLVLPDTTLAITPSTTPSTASTASSTGDGGAEAASTVSTGITPTASDDVPTSSTNTAPTTTEYFLSRQTTLQTCQAQLAELGSSVHICALNHASAKNPGGGFLKGSMAQEENLAINSGLYHCLYGSPMYEHHRRNNNQSLYSDFVIFSPSVPVIRADGDQPDLGLDDHDLLPEPYCISIVTCPAPNTKVAQGKGVTTDIIRQTTAHRLDCWLSVLVQHQVDVLVLGPWGCGVFGGSLEDLCWSFFQLLTGKYAGRFRRIVWTAINDPDYQVIQRNLSHYLKQE